MTEDESERRRRGESLFDDLFGKGSAFEGIFGPDGVFERALGEGRRSTEDRYTVEREFEAHKDTARKEREKSSGTDWAKEYANLARMVRGAAGVEQDALLGEAFSKLSSRVALLRNILRELNVQNDVNSTSFFTDQVLDQVRRALTTLKTREGDPDVLAADIRHIGETLGLVDPDSPDQVRGGVAELKRQVGAHELMWSRLRDVLGTDTQFAGSLVGEVEERLTRAKEDRALIEEHGQAVPKLSRVAGEYREALESIEAIVGVPKPDSNRHPSDIVEMVRALFERDVAENEAGRQFNERRDAELITIREAILAALNFEDDEKSPTPFYLGLLIGRQHAQKLRADKPGPGITLKAGDIIRATDYGALGIDPHIAVGYELATRRWVFTMLEQAGPAGSDERLRMISERNEAYEQVQARNQPEQEG